MLSFELEPKLFLDRGEDRGPAIRIALGPVAASKPVFKTEPPASNDDTVASSEASIPCKWGFLLMSEFRGYSRQVLSDVGGA